MKEAHLNDSRIIVPLSGSKLTGQRAKDLITLLADQVWGFKLHLPKLLRFYADGHDIARVICQKDLGLFIDLKGHDIPSETADMVRDCAALGANFITVHACGGYEMLEEVVVAAKKLPVPPSVFAVTVLTSTDEENCQLDFGGPIKAKVLQWARNAAHAGCVGTVSSGQELEFLSKQRGVARNSAGNEMFRITPGIRSSTELKPGDDQKRVMTPARAIELGAGYLVIGRPVLDAADPLSAATAINFEIDQALAKRAGVA